MNIKFSFKNLKGFNNKLKKRLGQDALRQVRSNVTRGTVIVRNYALENIQRGAKSGVTYELYDPRRTHTSSAPGQFPATDTGFLASQISTNVKTQGKQVIGQIISSAPYSKHLEFGTTKMAARPFMQPSLEKNSRKIKDIFKKGGYVD